MLLLFVGAILLGMCLETSLGWGVKIVKFVKEKI